MGLILHSFYARFNEYLWHIIWDYIKNNKMMGHIMKRLIIIAFLIFITTIEAKQNPVSLSISFGMFYSSLQPYGEWIELDNGVLAWQPSSMNPDWRPYMDGRWSWTRHGWYWDSYEPFGWATYHYGRWFNDDYYGWLWIPDYDWGPSWVEWRYDDEYIGWAPLPPYAEFRINLGIHFSISWHSDYHYWSFVPYHRFCYHKVGSFIIDHHRSREFFERTKYRNNYYMDRDRIVNGGIDRGFIEKKGGYRIASRDIREVNDYEKFEKSRKSGNDRIYSYRPSDRNSNENDDPSRYQIKRGERKSSLERDKIVISKDGRENPKRDVLREERNTNDRNTNRGNSYERKDSREERNNSRNEDSKNIRKESQSESQESRMNKQEKVERSERSSNVTRERKVERNNSNKSERSSSEKRTSSSERRR
jgi:hypothetical protein